MENATNFTDGFNNSTNGTFEGFQGATPKLGFWSGLLLPTLYLTVLIGSLYTFSSLYRKRQANKAAQLEPWFPSHKTRDIYLSLLHMDPSEGSNDEKKLKKVPDNVLKAALLRRAVEDIQRILQLRTSKPALQNLQQRGSVGDDLMQRFQRAEKEMEAEIKDVVEEANAFAPNWGQVIFQSANEINQHILLKERTAEIEAQRETEKEWWDNKKATIQSDFMKELDEEAEEKSTQQKKAGASDDEAVLVEAGGPAQAQGGSKKKGGKK